MTKPALKLVAPTTVKRKVLPNRRPKTAYRTRECLTEQEVEWLIEGCNGTRRPLRDQTMILLAFRHGLRASEVCDLQWSQVHFEAGTVTVTASRTASRRPIP
jgi:type 1 fimbriae regulatory protein FimB/type 1 fimbriae regulatory protein FimE